MSVLRAWLNQSATIIFAAGPAGRGRSCDGNDSAKLRELFGEPGTGKPHSWVANERPRTPAFVKLGFILAVVLVVLAFILFSAPLVG